VRLQNFYSLNRDPHAQLPASPNMVAVGSTNRLHSGANYGGTNDVLVLVQRKAAELKALEAEALRKQIDAMQVQQAQTEEAKRAAEEEMQRVRDEKDAENKAINEQLQALVATVQELQKPKPTWFQRWFLPKTD